MLKNKNDDFNDFLALGIFALVIFFVSLAVLMMFSGCAVKKTVVSASDIELLTKGESYTASWDGVAMSNTVFEAVQMELVKR